MVEEKIVVLADKYTCLGFKLAGITESIEAEGRHAEAKLVELLSREDVGIIVVSEKTVAEADWRLKKRLEGIAKPSIVTVPDKTGESFEGESLKTLVKRALGFELIK
ncbi:V-type ATP synthase subunit F [Candidatus Micrarchaeota archaeon]|nr:V-type ATP synthase subunit F [Candidatus Micrarchaeota archaeon]